MRPKKYNHCPKGPKQGREYTGMSQTELVDEIERCFGVRLARETISRWERTFGKKKALKSNPFNIVRMFSIALNIPADILCGVFESPGMRGQREIFRAALENHERLHELLKNLDCEVLDE